jgi:hypothetical protein
MYAYPKNNDAEVGKEHLRWRSDSSPLDSWTIAQFLEEGVFSLLR